MRTVRLALLWHQHQPNYLDPSSGEFLLPWVRLHAGKDYVDMVERLREFPGLRCTFNLVPSLLEQLERYAQGSGDRFEFVARQDSATIDGPGRRFHLRNFFSLGGAVGERRWPRLKEIRDRLPHHWTQLSDEELARRFPARDLRDLATLFHLGWLDRRHWAAAGLEALAERGRDFAEADKHRVLDAYAGVLARVVPAHREAWDSGQVEVSCSPFFHPILPLLLDPASALESVPEAVLPTHRWHFPQDAREQVDRALEYMQRVFGRTPTGMWPSEGSVSQATVELLASRGMAWAASDEGVLARSLGLSADGDRPVRRELYQPFRAGADPRMHLFFRDRELSDRIGFVYQSMDAKDAVRDFVKRLEQIGSAWKGDHDPVVTVALDGENCWENYEEDGEPFLQELYRALTTTDWIRTVTFSEVLPEFTDAPVLPRVFAGSWIFHNFRIWIGHPEDNEAWNRLCAAREAAEKVLGSDPDSQHRDALWAQVGAAEGSDWFWWYGDEHYTPDADLFDRLFRSRLEAIYRELGLETPARTFDPIKVHGPARAGWVLPRDYLRPTLDGRVTHFYEWDAAGRLSPDALGGAMHASHSLLVCAYFGFDRTSFHLRLAWCLAPGELDSRELEAVLEIWEPERREFALRPAPGRSGALSSRRQEGGAWEEGSPVGRWVQEDSLELSIPWEDLGCLPASRLRWRISLRTHGVLAEQIPSASLVELLVPGDESFEAYSWKA